MQYTYIEMLKCYKTAMRYSINIILLQLINDKSSYKYLNSVIRIYSVLQFENSEKYLKVQYMIRDSPSQVSI